MPIEMPVSKPLKYTAYETTSVMPIIQVEASSCIEVQRNYKYIFINISIIIII